MKPPEGRQASHVSGVEQTIRVRQGGRAISVRLACIEAPETAQRPWGQQARRYVQQRLSIGREVSLEVKTTDRYGVWQVPGGITRPWDFRRTRCSAVVPDGTTPGRRRYHCKEIGS